MARTMSGSKSSKLGSEKPGKCLRSACLTAGARVTVTFCSPRATVRAFRTDVARRGLSRDGEYADAFVLSDVIAKAETPAISRRGLLIDSEAHIRSLTCLARGIFGEGCNHRACF